MKAKIEKLNDRVWIEFSDLDLTDSILMEQFVNSSTDFIDDTIADNYKGRSQFAGQGCIRFNGVRVQNKVTTHIKFVSPFKYNKVKDLKKAGYIIPNKEELSILQKGDEVIAGGKRGIISHGIGEDGVENKYTVSFGHARCGWYTREELELVKTKQPSNEILEDPIGDLMWKGEIKMDKPQFTEEQFREFMNTVLPSYIFNEHDDIAEEHIFNDAMKLGYIIPVKSKEPKKLIYGVAFIDKGDYNASLKNIQTPQYRSWYAMIQRCYSDKFHKYSPSYIDCTVCEEWLNFQNFAKWYDENYYKIDGEKMQLDKDILVKGNKIYSPKTCIFVPQRINSLFMKRNTKRGEYPLGVSYNKKDKLYSVQCNNDIQSNNWVGSYKTVKEAFEAYKNFKEIFIKIIADRYKELIPSKLYKALYDYEVTND